MTFFPEVRYLLLQREVRCLLFSAHPFRDLIWINEKDYCFRPLRYLTGHRICKNIFLTIFATSVLTSYCDLVWTTKIWNLIVKVFYWYSLDPANVKIKMNIFFFFKRNYCVFVYLVFVILNAFFFFFFSQTLFLFHYFAHKITNNVIIKNLQISEAFFSFFSSFSSLAFVWIYIIITKKIHQLFKFTHK